MKENIFEKLRSIQSLTYTDGNGDEIRSILIDIAHEVNSIVKDYCDSKENVTVKLSDDEKIDFLCALNYAWDKDEMSDKSYINLIKKVCEL